MTLKQYNKLKKELDFFATSINFNMGKLDARWLERKMRDKDESHDKDIINLQNMYEGYIKMAELVKKYI